MSEKKPKNPVRPSAKAWRGQHTRSVRGGSWDFHDRDIDQLRINYGPASPVDAVGFRIARTKK